MSDVTGTVVLLVVLGLVAGLSSWGMVGALVQVRRGLGSGLYFTSGLVLARIVQGLLGGGAALAASSGLRGWFDPGPATYSIIMLAGAAVFVVSLLRRTRDASIPGPLTAEPESMVQERHTRAGPYQLLLTSLGLTLASPRQWLLTALAVSAIGELPSRRVAVYALFAVYLAAAVWFQLALLAVRVFRPRQAEALIDRVETWGRARSHRALSYAGMVLGGGLVVLGALGLAG